MLSLNKLLNYFAKAVEVGTELSLLKTLKTKKKAKSLD